MYENFFRLKEKPFSLTPDSQLVFPSRKHTEALEHLRYGILEKKGFVLITGEAGSGKTTLCRTFLKNAENNIEVALILNSFLSEIELLRAINRDFGINSNGETREQLITTLNHFLLEKKEENKTVVVMVDESQNLNTSVLEQLRMLSNLETEKEKLIQIVLLGQPELEQKLDQHELRQLNQRITIRFHIKPLDFYETQKYIYYRLHATSEEETTVEFTQRALRKIYNTTKGLPRKINALCDHTLLAAYVKESFVIDPALVQKAKKELKWTHKWSLPKISWQLSMGSATVLTLIVSTFIIGKSAFDFSGESQTINLTQEESFSEQTPIKKITRKKTPKQIQETVEQKAPLYFSKLDNAIWKCVQFWPGQKNLSLFDSEKNKLTRLKERGFDYADTWAGLGILSKINLPCVLQVNFPGNNENHYVILKALKDKKATLITSNNVPTVVSWKELEQMWHGKAYIPYFDPKGGEHTQIFIQNMKGKEVELMQQRLFDLGYLKGGVSGTYDGPTREAVERFQNDMGFPVDGVAGVETHLALFHLSEQKGTPFLVQAGTSTATMITYEENTF